jgi:hypothetical protein
LLDQQRPDRNFLLISPRLRGESNSQILTFRSIYNAFLITEDDILRLDLGPDWLVLTADRG